MRTKILFLILFCANYSFSQTVTIPNIQLNTPLTYTKQDLNNKYAIETDVKNKRSQIFSMDQSQVTIALTEVNKYNKQLEDLKSNYTNYLNKLPNLSDISDLPKLREFITEKTKLKSGLQNKFEENIKKQVFTRGLYLVVLPAGAGCENCGDIKSGDYPIIAQKALASKAIKELKDMLISSVTEITNKNDVSQRIESEVRGEMTLEQQLDDISQLSKGRRIFLLTVKVGNQTGKGYSENYENHSTELKPIEMVSCEHPDVLQKTFQKLAIDASTVERLNQKISEALPSMQQQNIETKNTVQSLWNNYTNEVAQLNKQIEEEIQKIKQKTQTLNNYIVDFFPNGIVASDLTDSIKKLTNQIYLKEQAINDTIRLLSSQKIFHPNQRKFSTSNNQTENEAITAALIEQSNQIESELSTSTAYTEITTVYNKQTEDVKKAQTTYSYGNINQLWAFVVPTEDEFILHLFVRRDVSKSQESPSKNTISTYRINLSVNNYSNIAKLKGSGTNYADGSIVPISIELTSNEYTFEGWYDESYELISSNNSCKVAINGRSRTITARISKKTLATNYDTDNSPTTTEQPSTPSKYYPPATTKTPTSTSADERIIENMEDILVGKWICTNDNYYKGMIIEIKKDFNSDEYVGKVIELRSDAYTIIQGRRFVRSSNDKIRLSSFKWRKITFVSNDQLDYFEAKVLKRDGSYVRGIIKFLNDETIQVSDNPESGIEIYKQLKFK